MSGLRVGGDENMSEKLGWETERGVLKETAGKGWGYLGVR